MTPKTKQKGSALHQVIVNFKA